MILHGFDKCARCEKTSFLYKFSDFAICDECIEFYSDKNAKDYRAKACDTFYEMSRQCVARGEDPFSKENLEKVKPLIADDIFEWVVVILRKSWEITEG